MQRELRLRRPADFYRLRQVGRVQRRPGLLRSIAANDLSHNRYGIIVSKRLGNAVQRNRLRRQLRSTLMTLHPQLEAGYDLVWVVQMPLKGQPYSAILRTVIELLQQAGLVDGTQLT